MKWIGKNIWWILCTLALGAVFVLCMIRVESAPLQFSVSSADGTQQIEVFQGADGISYVFLPAYARMDQVRLVLGNDESVTIGNCVLTDGMDCGEFALETDYALKDRSGKTATLRFYRSANVATMYIDTATRTTRHIHEDKDREEKASISVLRQDGALEYWEELGTIKGRGNTTWHYNKKPYVIKLSKNADLFGMGMATDWVLLANAADGSNLNNRIVYDLAHQTANVWTPNCTYVDLYLNGQYNGLYLLTEKVETADNRLEINTDSGDFFCEFSGAGSLEELSYCVTTERGRTAMILAPKNIDNTRKDQIAAQINQMEQALFSGGDLTFSTVIDLDSWARRYILDEISSNVDADRASCYFYCANGRFYAGPIWDYDKGFGNCQQSRNPWSFTADNEKRSAVSSLPYYEILCKNPSFQKRVRELYATEFLPLLKRLNEGGLAQLAETIAASSKMDRIRWDGLTPAMLSSALIPTDVNSVTEYLREKTKFLSSAWIDGVDYCTVQFELSPGAEYVNYAVKKGDVFAADNIDTVNTVWVVAKTGQIFDFAQPITENVILHLLPTSNAQPQTGAQEGLSTMELLTVGSLLAMGVLFLGMVGLDVYRTRKGRRR